MRTILTVLFIALFLILSIPILIIEYIIGKFNPLAKIKSSQKIVKFVFRIILFLSGVKYTVKGQVNVPNDLDTGLLYVSNHRSYFDIPVFYVSAPTLTGFVAKKEMAKIPLLKNWMKNINCLFLDRENIREGLKTILEGIDKIKNGHSMYIAPEGTRSQSKEMLPFKEGSFKMAEKSGCPIIPVCITGTDDVLENHSPWIKKTHVIIEYCKPIYIKELSKDDRKFIGSYVQNLMKETLETHHI